MNKLDQLKTQFDRSVEATLANPLHGLPPWSGEVEWSSSNDLSFVICGTGFWASVFLHYAGAFNVIAVVDDGHPDETILGHPCLSSTDFIDLVHKRPDVICINSGQSDAGFSHFERIGQERGMKMLNTLQATRALGLETDIRVADWGRAIAERADCFHETERLLVDSYSAETLYSALLFHLDTDRDHLLRINRPADAAYFRSGLFDVSSDEVYVDAGAFTGDSVQTFIQACHGEFQAIHAYEPDPENFARLEIWKSRQTLHPYKTKISLHQEAVGDQAGTIRFNSNSDAGSYVPIGSPAAVDSPAAINSIKIPCVTLDEAIDEPISLLKLDIEGQELNALKGARGHLKASRPNLAVCAYHLPTDLIDLPRFIAGLDKGYRLGLRHHSNVRYDTILYAF